MGRSAPLRFDCEPQIQPSVAMQPLSRSAVAETPSLKFVRTVARMEPTAAFGGTRGVGSSTAIVELRLADPIVGIHSDDSAT